jgi:GDP-mannose 6-dehydrogenase
LIESLIGKGFELAIYDRDVSLAKLVGANKEYIEREIPHISKLMRDSVDAVLADSQIVIVGNQAQEFRDVAERLQTGQQLIDLVRLFDRRTSSDNYQGICW